jgi:hypothetical protein
MQKEEQGDLRLVTSLLRVSISTPWNEGVDLMGGFLMILLSAQGFLKGGQRSFQSVCVCVCVCVCARAHARAGDTEFVCVCCRDRKR